MPDYFKANLDDEKTLEDLELSDKMISIQAYLMDLLETEKGAPAAYFHGYIKGMIDFATALYREL